MRLSIAMISEAFSDYPHRSDFHGFDALLTIDCFRFYENETHLHADTLYIFTEADPSVLPLSSFSIEDGASLLFTHPAENMFRSAHCAVISFEGSGISAEKVSNILSNTFERFRRIDDAMHACIREQGSLQKLVETATPLFTNELTIRNREFRYVAHSFKTLRFNKETPIDEKGFSSPDELIMLKSDPLYSESNPVDDTWYFNYHGQNMWCQDIYIKNEFLYRIKLIDVNHPFRPYDRSLVHYFAGLVKEYQFLAPEDPEDEGLKNSFTGLLEEGSVTVDTRFRAQLESLGWNGNDTYKILVLSGGRNSGVMKAYRFYCNYINRTFPYMYALIYEGDIAVFADLTAGKLTSDQFLGELAAFLRDENFRAGISYPFTGIGASAVHYKQAKTALRLGLAYTPTIWSYRFRHYRPYYLLELLRTDFDHSEHLLPGLHALHEYDSERGTELFRTLSVYMEANENVSQAAEILGIHRSTLQSRLKKIRELFGENMDKPQTKALIRLLLALDEIDPGFNAGN